MDPADGFLSPPAVPQAAVKLPVLDLNGPSAGLAVPAANPADENDQGNIVMTLDAPGVNGLTPEAYAILSPEQTHNAPAGVTGPQMPHPEPNMKVCIHICLRCAFYSSLRSWVSN